MIITSFFNSIPSFKPTFKNKEHKKVIRLSWPEDTTHSNLFPCNSRGSAAFTVLVS